APARLTARLDAEAHRVARGLGRPAVRAHRPARRAEDRRRGRGRGRRRSRRAPARLVSGGPFVRPSPRAGGPARGPPTRTFAPRSVLGGRRYPACRGGTRGNG